MGQLCAAMVGLFFPGQGAQSVGMGKGLFDSFSGARKLFEEADSILGYALSKIIFEGPEEELTKTIHSQPAIYLTSLVALSCLKEKVPNLKISSACGLSLGEFSALAALNVFSFEEGLKLVHKRGRWMEEAAAQTEGGMVSIVGLKLEACEELAKAAGLQIANINSSEQIVLSGKRSRVEKALELAKEKGAKRAVRLNVSGAFHSELMKEAEVKLTAFLSGISFREPDGLFLSNVTGRFESDPQKIKENSAQQVTRSVRWVQTLQTLHQTKENYFIELAPGKVLKGLARRTFKDMVVENLESEGDLKKIVHSLKEREALHAS